MPALSIHTVLFFFSFSVPCMLPFAGCDAFIEYLPHTPYVMCQEGKVVYNPTVTSHSSGGILFLDYQLSFLDF